MLKYAYAGSNIAGEFSTYNRRHSFQHVSKNSKKMWRVIKGGNKYEKVDLIPFFSNFWYIG